MAHTKGGGTPNCPWRWTLMVPVWLILTEGTVADCSQAILLIDGIGAEHLLADKGYDTNEIVAAA